MLGASFRRGQAGASLIEVLVSIVIASVGLLALAGVNASAVRYGKLTQFRATASQLASDLGERMRANKAGYTAGAYVYAVNFATQSASAITAPGNTCSSAGVTCTAAEVAAADLWQWRQTVRDNLPGGSVYLLRDATPAAADLWVVWRDPSVSSDDENPASATECPDGLARGGDLTVRCMYFRINL